MVREILIFCVGKKNRARDDDALCTIEWKIITMHSLGAFLHRHKLMLQAKRMVRFADHLFMQKPTSATRKMHN